MKLVVVERCGQCMFVQRFIGEQDGTSVVCGIAPTKTKKTKDGPIEEPIPLPLIGNELQPEQCPLRMEKTILVSAKQPTWIGADAPPQWVEALRKLHEKKEHSPPLTSFVVYGPTTTDYPGEWVVRRQLIQGGEIVIDVELTARGKTLKQCLDALHGAAPITQGMTFIPRSEADDEVIHGTFM